MRKIVLLFLLLPLLGISQTASSLDKSHIWFPSEGAPLDSAQRSVSAYNPYLLDGFKLATVLRSSVDLSNNLIFNVRFRKELYTGRRFSFPLISNISLGDWTKVSDEYAILTDQGLSIGLFPYFLIEKGALTIVPHFEFSGKILPGESFEESKKRYKMAGNIELHLAKQNGEKNTVSIGVFYSSNQNMEPKNSYGLDLTALIAIDENSAFLIDYKKPFSGLGLLGLGIVVR